MILGYKLENVAEHICEENLGSKCICKICLQRCHDISRAIRNRMGSGEEIDRCNRCGDEERYYDCTGTIIQNTLYYEWESGMPKTEMRGEITEEKALESFESDSYCDVAIARGALKSRFKLVREKAINMMTYSELNIKTLEFIVEKDTEEHFRNLASHKLEQLEKANQSVKEIESSNDVVESEQEKCPNCVTERYKRRSHYKRGNCPTCGKHHHAWVDHGGGLGSGTVIRWCYWCHQYSVFNDDTGSDTSLGYTPDFNTLHIEWHNCYDFIDQTGVCIICKKHFPSKS